jgi:DNA-cytosine methyltransferase
MTNNKIKVLSLFDGIAGCRQALKELNIDCDYYASEIDKYAIKVANHNHPDIVQIGDVKSCDFKQFKDIDLLSAGFPCQSYSMAGNRKGLKDERGQLIYDVFRALKDCKPKYFLLENVKGLLSIDKGETFKNILSELNHCGYAVDWIVINSSLVTAQNRQRLYWVGKLIDGEYKKIKIEQPKDQEIYLKDIIEEETVNVIATQLGNSKNWGNAINSSGKAFTLRASQPNGVIIDQNIRKLTPNECCRLQGFPDGYCDSVSKTQGYKGLGNSFTVPIIKHLIKQILK